MSLKSGIRILSANPHIKEVVARTPLKFGAVVVERCPFCEVKFEPVRIPYIPMYSVKLYNVGIGKGWEFAYIAQPPLLYKITSSRLSPQTSAQLL